VVVPRVRRVFGDGFGVYDRAMARIEQYSFGSVVVEGERHSRDVIVLPGRVVGDWWRRDGHSLVIDDLDQVLDELPERLIVGCGAHGRLHPHPSVLDALAERGVEVEAVPTDEAVRRYSESDPARTAAALHLTC
jgi:hypothetical protein